MKNIFIPCVLFMFIACHAYGSIEGNEPATFHDEYGLLAMGQVPVPPAGDGVSTFRRVPPPAGKTVPSEKQTLPEAAATVSPPSGVQGETAKPAVQPRFEPGYVEGTAQPPAAPPATPPVTPPATPPAAPPGTPLTPGQMETSMPQQIAPRPAPEGENYIILNFDNAALKDVINTVSSITGENFIISPGLDARITIHSTGKIPTKEALNIFESVLEVNNMALVRSGAFYKIVQSATAKQKPIEVIKGSNAEAIPSIDRIVTQIVQVDYVPAGEIIKIIQPMLSPNGAIVSDPRTNLLIINEVSSNLKRLLTIMDEVDIDAFENSRMMFFRPQYSDITTLSEELKEILTGLNIAQQGILIIPVERINSLVIFAASPNLLKAVEGWLIKLDEEVSTGQNVFVYPVQNVKAEDIIDVLQMIYGKEGGSTQKKTASPATPAAAAQKAGAPAQAVKSPAQQVTSAEGNVEITVYEPTNSLVILASPGIYRDMQETIKKLDVYPQEVLIEAIIAQVTLTDTDKFGIQWSVLSDVNVEGDNISYLLQQRSGDSPAYSFPPALGADSSKASVIAGGLTYFLYRPERFAALIQALSSRGKVNILSSPRLLVKDQEEASIEVGSDVPTATSTTTATTTDTLTQNIEYRTVGVKLNIKPTINDEKTVVLDIEQEVSSKGADQQVGQTGNLFPSFNTTKTKTSIIVPNKQGIVIGGLMEETKDKNYQGVPILSAIPVLGHLFRYTTDSATKKELIILITPHVIDNKTEAADTTEEFLKSLRAMKDFLEERGMLDVAPLPPAEEIKTPEQTNEQ